MAVNPLQHVAQLGAQSALPSSIDTLMNAIRAFHRRPLFSTDSAVQKGQIDRMIDNINQRPIFDFTAADLGKAFVQAIEEGFDDSWTYGTLLSFQQRTGLISPRGQYGLGHALNIAIKKRDVEAFAHILAQQNYREISAQREDDPYGLNFALLECLRQLYIELNKEPVYKNFTDTTFLKEIIRHPNAIHITNLETIDPYFNPIIDTRRVSELKGYTEIVQLIDEFRNLFNR